MNTLQYKEYEGTAELDMERQICRGKILFINDLIIYEAATPAGLQHAFEYAVDDYIETCRDLGIEAKKPLKGQFNVRIPPALHRAAVVFATRNEMYLNEVVVRALDSFINASQDINHNIRVTFDLDENAIQTMMVNPAMETQWVGSISNAKTH